MFSSEILFKYGKYYRIWPFSIKNDKISYITVSPSRPFVKLQCKLLKLEFSKKNIVTVFDFYQLNKRATTTGQPFITQDGTFLIPVWNVCFYTQGVTYFAIYRSNDGYDWQKVYEDLDGTYAKHFFQNPNNGDIFIGVGIKGGGKNGKISYTPDRVYLLKSVDEGKTWNKVLKIDHPTAMYDGAVIDDKTLIVTLREMKSIAKSNDAGNSWSIDYLGSTARNITYMKDDEKIILSSDSSLYLSPSEQINWEKINIPFKGLALRYPKVYNDMILMTGVGWGSFLFAVNKLDPSIFYYLDLTKMSNSNYMARMSMFDDTLLIGDELETGSLISIKSPEHGLKLVKKSDVLLNDIKRISFTLNHMIKGNV